MVSLMITRKNAVVYIFWMALLIASVFSTPMLVEAQGIIPCEGTGTSKCGFDELVILVQNGIDLIIQLAMLVAAIAFVYAGFVYATSAGNMEQVKKAHGIFRNVSIGFVIVLGAWLFIHMIASALLSQPLLFLGDP